MRIGVSGGGRDANRVAEQATRAEAEGFSTIWFAGGADGDPLLNAAFAGHATTQIEVGTAVVQTYPTHPVHLAGRAVAVADAMRRPGFVLGVGPSHQPIIEGMYGLSFEHPGRHTEEYLQILSAALRGTGVEVDGRDYQVTVAATGKDSGVPVLVAALAPRLLRVAGEVADGTVTWMANARAVDSHVAPRITRAAEGAGRPTPRIVAGLPIAVHDDVDEARGAAAKQFAMYGTLPNYQRILAAGGAEGPADAVIVGDEASVTAQIEALFDAGATDFWAAPFVVGEDRNASRVRTRTLLADLASR